MIDIDTAYLELHAHRKRLATGKFTVEHADFYAKRAAKGTRSDPFTYRRTFSLLMKGFMVPHDIPRGSRDTQGVFDN